MSRKRGTVHIGTSGWQYRHWIGRFYPQKLPAERMLRAYARHFSTTEINGTFYRLPDLKAVANWVGATPPGFVFSCKANRYITHLKKLKDPGISLPAFLEVVAALGDKAGPVLYQLPPRWRVNLDRLTGFLANLPPDRRHVFEFRDPSWWTDDLLELLREHGAGFCIFDLSGTETVKAVTADFAYVRLHGPGAAYCGSYSDQALAHWAARIDDWAAQGLDVFVYFDNDADASAPLNARTLLAMTNARRQTDAARRSRA